MEESRFTQYDMLNEENWSDLQKWVDNEELVALVDEEEGGIIGYINPVHMDKILNLLNK